jgi:hypothetical protein
MLFLAGNDLLDGVSLDVHADKVVKESLQVKLDALDVLRVSQDIDELIIGEEEESREVTTFLSHVVLESIVTLLEQVVVGLQVCNRVPVRRSLQVTDWVVLLTELLHEACELLVDQHELAVLLRQRFLDVC